MRRAGTLAAASFAGTFKRDIGGAASHLHALRAFEGADGVAGAGAYDAVSAAGAVQGKV